MAERTRVVIAGFGRLGAELARGLAESDEVEVVGIARRTAAGASVTVGGRDVPVSTELASLLDQTRPRVLVEASLPDAVATHVRAALERGVSPVIATSGVPPELIEELGKACRERRLGAVVAPNLSLGAVVLMHLAGIAGRFFDSVEIIEMHRDKKADAPSGTAMHTARLLAEARGRPFVRPPTTKLTLPEVRGGESHGIGIHSVRLPGLVAHQEVLFGGQGQTLTLRHDATSNEAYVPGALLAIRHVLQTQSLTVGLAALLGLE
ncbi:MAG TPA: 4-hydroxy-tetrahydrodipicolinate reductase [Chloroflexota bacterium]|nr:4-hydroxy-tetrahydrodipicolinate reductase [Chloroflexota bacterium]